MRRVAAPLLALVTVAACGTKAPTTSELLAPPPEGQGIQLKMLSKIEPGQDIEKCKFFQVQQSDGIFVIKDEVKYSGGSHHVLVYRTRYTSVPTQSIRGKTIDTSDVFDCAEGATADWDIDGVTSGAQASGGDPLISNLPAGTAVKFEPGTVLLMNTHYLNATSTAVDTDARVNLWTIPKAQVTQEAGIIFFYNPYISIPPSGTSSARMSCPINGNVTLVNGQSHMHRRGVGYVANLVDGTGAKMEEIYKGTDWENVSVKVYGSKALTKGTGVDFRCDYKSTEARAIAQGNSTKDEMCMFIGLYYPRDRDFEQCAVPNGPPSSNATFIGGGATSCGEAVTCTQAAKDAASYYACVINSCPANAPQVSALLRCQYLATEGSNATCRTACSGTDSMACSSCIIAACQAELNTCFAAACM